MKSLFTLLFTFLFYSSSAQIFTVQAGAGLTIQSGALFQADGITLVPSADFTINNNALTRNTAITNPPTYPNPYISRVYLFNNNTPPFSGTIQINYLPSELNGIPEANLELNEFNGTEWLPYAGTVNTVNDFVLSNPVSNLILRELTLASSFAPLPLTWLDFTAQKQNSTALLKWQTANEQNTKNFTPQFSMDSRFWINLGIVPALGNSNGSSFYNFVHTQPITGINYYRILQTDRDGRNSLSEVRQVKFDKADGDFFVVNNPASNTLQVQVSKQMLLSLFASDGKLLMTKPATVGVLNIDVSKYPAGIYFLRGQHKTVKIFINSF